MKKKIALLLIVCLALGMAGCGKNQAHEIDAACPAICIDGVTYYDTGKAVPVEPDESVIEYVEIPLGGGASGSIEAFARLEEGRMIVCLINNEWYEFTVK